MLIIRFSQTRHPFKPHVLQRRILPTLLFKTSTSQKPLKEKQSSTITWNSWWEFEFLEFRKTLLLRLEEWPTDDTKTWDLGILSALDAVLKKPWSFGIDKFVCLWFSDLSLDSLYWYVFEFYSEYNFYT